MSCHLALEAVDVLRTRAGVDQVVHIHADNEFLLTPSPRVQHVPCCVVCEPKRAQRGVKLRVPRPRGLPLSVERLAQSEHLMLCSLYDEARSLLDEDRLCQLVVEEGRFDVQLMNAPVLRH